MASGHQRNVAALQGCIPHARGVPATEPADAWSSLTLLRDELSVQQLLEAEECGLAEYVAALTILEGEVRDLVLRELIPRQRHHVAALSKILIDFCPP